MECREECGRLRWNEGGATVVQLDGDDYEHAEVGAEKAKQRAESVPKLADDDAVTDGGRDFGRDVVSERRR